MKSMKCPCFMTLRCFLTNTRRNFSYTTINRYLQKNRTTKTCWSSILCCSASRYISRSIFRNLRPVTFPYLADDKVNSNDIMKGITKRQFVTDMVLEKKNTTTEEYHSSDSESDDEDLNADDFGEFSEDYDAPANYKNKEITVNSARAAAILASSLGTTRSAMDEAFYGRKLLVNGELLKKKGAKLEDGDYIDLIVGHEENGKKVRRVRILKILKEKTAKDRQKMMVRVWKTAFTIRQ